MRPLALVHRQAFSSGYARIASSVTLLCRTGALLAVLQLVAWFGIRAGLPGTGATMASGPDRSDMVAMSSVVDHDIIGLLYAPEFVEAPKRSRFEVVLGATREIARTLLWGIVVILLPLVITLGLLAPFIREEDGMRVFFGVLAVLGLLPLSAAEASPLLGIDYTTVEVPRSILAGVAAPVVAAVLLISGTVLLSSRAERHRRSRVDRDEERFSPRELETIIRRGDHPRKHRDGRVRSTRSRRRRP